MGKNKPKKKPCEDCFCAKPSGMGAEDTSTVLGAKGCVVPAL